MVRSNLLDLISRDFSQVDSFLKSRRDPALFNLRPVFQFASSAVPQLATDIFEGKTSYIYKINAPGFKKENLSLSIEEGILSVSIKAEEKIEMAPVQSTEESPEVNQEGNAIQEEPQKLLYSERNVTRTQRQYQLAEDADPTQVSAQFNDGVLELVIGKKAEILPQVTQIEIK